MLRHSLRHAHRSLVIASSSTSAHINNNTKRSFSNITPRQLQRLRRSVHFIPGDNRPFLSKALSLNADTIVLDLEDSVKDKEVGRATVAEYLESIAELRRNNGSGSIRSGTEVLVRINPLSGEGWREDVRVGLLSDGFMVPKVESGEELRMLDDVLKELEQQHHHHNVVGGIIKPKVLLPIATETPAAVLNIADIAKGPRVVAITWGCEDLSAELGSYGTRNADSGEYFGIFQHCRNMCLLAAKAAGVQAIDGIYQNVRDVKGFEKETREAKYMGFDGKLTLHPDQISMLHRVFEPTKEELQEANEIVGMWEERGGKGSLEYKGKMIDLPHYVRAKKVVARGGDDSIASNDERTVDDCTKQTANASNDKDGTKDEEVFPRVYMGKYFEDLEPGLKIRHFLTRTVTEADNVFFTCLTLNPAPIHLDHELSKGNISALSGGSGDANSGKPLFNSMFTLALLVGMSVPEATHGTTVANLGFSEVLFPKPVYPGDTLRAETEVLDRRKSRSRPAQGIVTMQHVAFNQRGEVVCKATRQALMKKRGSSQ